MQFELIKRIRGSISARLAVLFCLTFSVGLVSAFAISYLQIEYTLEKSRKEILSAKLAECATVLEEKGPKGVETFLSEDKNKLINAPYLIRVLDSSGKPIFTKPSVQEKKFDFETAFKSMNEPRDIKKWISIGAVDDEDKFEVLTEKVGSGYFLQVGKSNEEHEDVLGWVLGVFLAIGTVFIVLSGAGGLWYARKSLEPLRELFSAIRSIESGDLTKRTSIADSKGELRDLGETFNRMANRIENLVKAMRDSLDNVAHDIRTPLTRIRIVAEDAMTSSQPISLQEALLECAESSSNISEIVDQLMSISEAEAGALNLKQEPCNVSLLLKDVAEIYEFVAAEKSINIRIDDADSALKWTMDPKRVKQAVANLLDNAIKFSSERTQVSLSAKQEKHLLSIYVQDQGPGVSEADLPHLWERLYRGDKSRSTKGAGLGLSIVRAVTMAHGGSAEARHNPDGGMTFTIRIPENL